MQIFFDWQNEADNTTADLAGRRCFVEGLSERCRGCGLCELVCSICHEGEARPKSSRIQVEKDRDNYQFRLSVCFQCEKPQCVPACPTGAIKVERKSGAKIIEKELCDNCGLCADACPFNSDGNIIFAHPSKELYVKCDLCFFRDSGPACIEICPTHALVLKEIKGGVK